MKLASIGGAVAGLAAIGGLIAYLGAEAVFRSLFAIAWRGFWAVFLIHLALVAVMGVAWRALVPGARAWVFIWGRFVRDAGSEENPGARTGHERSPGDAHDRDE